MKITKTLAGVICGLTIIAPAAGGLIEGVDLEAGIEIGNFMYRESHFMSEEGYQYGVYGSIAILAARPWYFQLFASYVGGDVEYDGGYEIGGRHYTLIGDTSNYILNFRGIVGYILNETGRLSIMPYSGLAYRYLENDLRDLEKPGIPARGYLREQTYFYLPLGVDISLPLGYDGTWTVGLRSEFDWMFYGFNRSGGIKLDNQQGWGFRLTPYARWNVSEQVALKLEIFGEYWKIGDSDVNMGFMEPENASNYYGARAGICF